MHLGKQELPHETKEIQKVFCNQNIPSGRMKEEEEELCLIEKRQETKLHGLMLTYIQNCRETN